MPSLLLEWGQRKILFHYSSNSLGGLRNRGHFSCASFGSMCVILRALVHKLAVGVHDHRVAAARTLHQLRSVNCDRSEENVLKKTIFADLYVDAFAVPACFPAVDVNNRA